eukprot:12425096-Karenia_brevis.AAC.1
MALGVEKMTLGVENLIIIIIITICTLCAVEHGLPGVGGFKTRCNHAQERVRGLPGSLEIEFRDRISKTQEDRQ